MSARVTATLRPVRSQVVVLAFTIVGAISLCTGFAFIWYSKPMPAIPLVGGGLLLAAAFLMWWQSSRDVDQIDAPPTIFSTPGGMVQTDSRNVDKKALTKALARAINHYANWAPLPNAQGLVGRDGQPIANTELDAVARVEAANAEAELQFAPLAARIEGAKIAQTSSVGLPSVGAADLRRDGIEPGDN